MNNDFMGGKKMQGNMSGMLVITSNFEGFNNKTAAWTTKKVILSSSLIYKIIKSVLRNGSKVRRNGYLSV